MKKTIALLLAMAGMAMGENSIDLTGKWSGNTADLSNVSFGDNEKNITVAFTLNWNELTKVGASKALDYFFYIQDGENQHIGQGKEKGYIGGHFVTQQFGTELYGAMINVEGAPITRAVESVTSIFTLQLVGGMYEMHNYLYLWDEEGVLIGDVLSGVETFKFYKPSEPYFSMLVINETFTSSDSIKVYSDIFDETERLAVAESFLNSGSSDPTIPEPTTATLSLLALSALAARRRRK